MLTKWFESRTSRALKDRSFRPCLESLEERNAPSGLGHGGDDDHGHPHFPPFPTVNNGAVVNTGVSAGINAHGSFNGSTITGSFNTTINNNVTVNLLPGQTLAVSGLLGITGALAASLNNSQLGTLLNDEITLAVDTYLTTPAISSALGLSSSVVSTLKADEATLSAAIAANPLESNPIAATLGTLAFDVTMSALTSAQATI